MKHKIKLKWIWFKSFFKSELKQTYAAGKILLHIIEGRETTPEQIQFLKDQSIDCGKVLTIIGLQAIPGSSVGLIALEAVGRKHGFTIFPVEQEIPEIK